MTSEGYITNHSSGGMNSKPERERPWRIQKQVYMARGGVDVKGFAGDTSSDECEQ